MPQTKIKYRVTSNPTHKIKHKSIKNNIENTFLPDFYKVELIKEHLNFKLKRY